MGKCSYRAIFVYPIPRTIFFALLGCGQNFIHIKLSNINKNNVVQVQDQFAFGLSI
jgi:hypothetical protein